MYNARFRLIEALTLLLAVARKLITVYLEDWSALSAMAGCAELLGQILSDERRAPQAK